MSSKLKDARWQLAKEMAVDAGLDFFEANFAQKNELLAVAQMRLAARPEMIAAYAAEWNREDG